MLNSKKILKLAMIGLAIGHVPGIFAQASPTGSVTTPDGLELAYISRGSGSDTVLVIHGGPGLSSGSIRADLEQLSRDRTVIYYDQRGSGWSTPLADSLQVSAEQHVADLELVRRHFGLDRIKIVAHSWGAGLAALYAMRHPDRVARMLLVAPMPPRRDPYMRQFGLNLYAWMDSDTRSRVASAERARLNALDPVAACRAYWALFIRSYFADPRGNARIQGDFCAGAPENLGNLVARRTLGSLGNWDWREGAATIDVPVLIIHGARDPVPLESAREWATAVPDARLLVLDRSGHVPYAEQPEDFFPAAAEFLNGSWPAAAVATHQ